MSRAVSGATPQQVFDLAMADRSMAVVAEDPMEAMGHSPFMALAALACEAHRYLHGHPCRPPGSQLLAHVDALPGTVGMQDRVIAGAYVRAWFDANAAGHPEVARRSISLYSMMGHHQRAAVTAVAAGYAAEHLDRLPARVRSVLALTYTHAATPAGSYAHIYAAMLAEAWASDQVMRMFQIAGWAKTCAGPVLPDIVWVCLRTAAAFVVPGSPLPVSALGCNCGDDAEAAAILSCWAADVAAGKRDMRQFLHTQVRQYAARDTVVADHLVTCAVALLAAIPTPESS